jgi:hypothetical protein
MEGYWEANLRTPPPILLGSLLVTSPGTKGLGIGNYIIIIIFIIFCGTRA